MSTTRTTTTVVEHEEPDPLRYSLADLGWTDGDLEVWRSSWAGWCIRLAVVLIVGLVRLLVLRPIERLAWTMIAWGEEWPEDGEDDVVDAELVEDGTGDGSWEIGGEGNLNRG